MGYYTDQLTRIRANITEIMETGQSIRGSDGRQLEHADLPGLHELEQYYEKRAAAEANPKQGRNRIIYPTPHL